MRTGLAATRRAAITMRKSKIELLDAYRGAQRTITLRVPMIDAQGNVTLGERRLDVTVPKGVREGQHLRLAGQGGPGFGEGPAGDLYLEIAFRPDGQFRVEGRDVYMDLPLAPWEAALGAAVTATTPDGPVQLTVPPGSAAGRKLAPEGQGHSGHTARRSIRGAVDRAPARRYRTREGSLSRVCQGFRFQPQTEPGR